MLSKVAFFFEIISKICQKVPKTFSLEIHIQAQSVPTTGTLVVKISQPSKARLHQNFSADIFGDCLHFSLSAKNQQKGCSYYIFILMYMCIYIGGVMFLSHSVLHRKFVQCCSI